MEKSTQCICVIYLGLKLERKKSENIINMMEIDLFIGHNLVKMVQKEVFEQPEKKILIVEIIFSRWAVLFYQAVSLKLCIHGIKNDIVHTWSLMYCLSFTEDSIKGATSHISRK